MPQGEPVKKKKQANHKQADPAKQIAKEAEAQAKQGEMAAVVKELESAFFAMKFYPVAVNEDSKDEAVRKLEKMYQEGNDAVKQMLLYMVHENLAQSAEMRIMHTTDYFKARSQSQGPGQLRIQSQGQSQSQAQTQSQDPSQLRMSVYRSMFNYQTSIEGQVEFIRFLGRLRGSDDGAKLLTYHFSHLSGQESESNHMLKAAIIEALGKSESRYALKALLEYARYNDHERTFQRIVTALADWDEKIDTLKVSDEERGRLRAKLQELMSRQVGGESHYR